MHQPTHCAYCAYRRAAGDLTIRSTTTTSKTEPVCSTCAREALAYYDQHPCRATFTPWPKP